MNKIGTDKILSIYWFAILFIVAAAVVYMSVSFYGNPYDVREIESKIMINNLADCFSEGGYLREEIIFEGNFLLNESNFLEICNLNFNVEDYSGWENNQYFVKINFYDLLGNSIFEISKGNINLKQDCEKTEKNFPVCVEREFHSLDNNENKYLIKILSVFYEN